MSLKDTRGFLLLNGLTPRDRRAILVGLGILLPAVAYVLGVRPYRAALEGVRDRVAAERELLTRELALLADRSDTSGGAPAGRIRGGRIRGPNGPGGQRRAGGVGVDRLSGEGRPSEAGSCWRKSEVVSWEGGRYRPRGSRWFACISEGKAIWKGF